MDPIRKIHIKIRRKTNMRTKDKRLCIGNKVVLVKPHAGVHGIAMVMRMTSSEVWITAPGLPKEGVAVPFSDVRRAKPADFI